MPVYSHAALTIRVTGVPNNTPQDSLEQRAQGYCDVSSKTSFFGRREIVPNLPLLISLAPQRDSQTGTVTFPSEKSKKRALSSMRTWPVDDEFVGLTTLYSSSEPDLEWASSSQSRKDANRGIASAQSTASTGMPLIHGHGTTETCGSATF